MDEARTFTISVADPDDGPVVVSLAGEMDIASAPELARALEALGGANATAVVIDLSALTFIDSSGISVLATAARDARARGGELVVAAPEGDVRRVFEIVRLAEIVPLEDSLSAALRRLDGSGAP
jgi:anti-sigma B factor antagonist